MTGMAFAPCAVAADGEASTIARLAMRRSASRRSIRSGLRQRPVEIGATIAIVAPHRAQLRNHRDVHIGHHDVLTLVVRLRDDLAARIDDEARAEVMATRATDVD